MKIKRHLLTDKTSGIEVSGPGLESRPAPNAKAGIALALDLAAKLGKPGTFYVREHGTVIQLADGDGKGGSRLV